MKVKKNTVVSLIYRLTDAQDNLIEESAEPMIYLHGDYEGTFPKIEEALEGQEIGFETRLQLEPADAFGEYDAEFEGIPGLDEVSDDPQSLSEVDEDEDDTLYIYTITDLAEDRVILDANHPLAGLALRFWIQVANIRPATNEEVSNGRADGQTGLMIGNDEEDYENLDDYLDSASANHPTLH
ncbi:MAG: hypothetical protein RIR83_75 [Pseudomonadota bacterium]